jgi:hypothetical protein
MMKTIDDLDPVSYQMLMHLLHDVFKYKRDDALGYKLEAGNH